MDTKLTSDRQKIDLGMDAALLEKIGSGLAQLLADSIVLYHQLRNFHWNVRGAHFKSLHELFEEQYTELVEGIDVVAERIRSLGMRAPGTMKELAELSTLEEVGGMPSSEEMITTLVKQHEELIRNARNIFDVTDKAKDEASADLVTERLRVHEKEAWMLRSYLQ